MGSYRVASKSKHVPKDFLGYNHGGPLPVCAAGLTRKGFQKLVALCEEELRRYEFGHLLWLEEGTIYLFWPDAEQNRIQVGDLFQQCRYRRQGEWQGFIAPALRERIEGLRWIAVERAAHC